MPEVAGGAALLVDPFQEKDIAEKMKMLVNSEELQKQLVEKGLERKDAFSWDYTASQLWKCIENVLVRINA
jgi:glycosyltransferase involved in cell wall biosynthesis